MRRSVMLIVAALALAPTFADYKLCEECFSRQSVRNRFCTKCGNRLGEAKVETAAPELPDVAPSDSGASPLGLGFFTPLAFPGEDADVSGLDFGVFAAWHRDVRGVQLASLAVSAERAGCLQVSSFLCYAGYGGAVQLAAGCCWANNTDFAMQISLVNCAQYAGCFQIGLINYAEGGSGFQLGLWNQSDNFMCPVLGIVW